MTLRPPTVVPIAPDDPLHMVVAAVEGLQRQSLKDLSNLVTKLSDDVAASAVRAENAAQTRAETTISQAGEWTADQIRTAAKEAGEAMAVILEQARQEAIDDIRRLTNALMIGLPLSLLLWTGLVAALWWLFR